LVWVEIDQQHVGIHAATVPRVPALAGRRGTLR